MTIANCLAPLALPVLRRFDAETAHGLTIKALKAGLGPTARADRHPSLAVEAFGLRFPNPVGLSAGFDKNAEVPGPMLRAGFGFVEIGTVTPRPQPGNPRPRIFRLPADRAVINRLGFNNEGAEAARRRLDIFRAEGPAGLLGVNLGKNKDSEDAAADYRIGAETLAEFADYLVINVSSPNTPGLRALQSIHELSRLVEAVRDARDRVVTGRPAPAILVKIAPDLETADEEAIARFASEGGCDGLIISNTTINRPDDLRETRLAKETGGLSGRPLFAPSTERLARMARLTQGRVPLVGVGGIGGPADARAKLEAGATLVQLYSALVYEGPGLVPRILDGLAGYRT
ncbi:quinone-dependent dihydroorotate dehydrogenase [Marivibrio halodurans]|uniref:Dihydroorotate dehydrogenase (quinone) n=1 Tax=Marivibrio halodurans TaxID=2039722 RepID=A0A8J7V022_9PROT|nr:quinone-dependent dihydroorotate dehydrogenase [Marivibrio halodurans]MBP5856291.1 quinone-dependent dihydroorotate dehydrogenase [Marivibrio halodurans]